MRWEETEIKLLMVISTELQTVATSVVCFMICPVIYSAVLVLNGRPSFNPLEDEDAFIQPTFPSIPVFLIMSFHNLCSYITEVFIFRIEMINKKKMLGI